MLISDLSHTEIRNVKLGHKLLGQHPNYVYLLELIIALFVSTISVGVSV